MNVNMNVIELELQRRHDRIMQLRNENDCLRNENDCLRNENDCLRKEMEFLKQRNKDLRQKTWFNVYEENLKLVEKEKEHLEYEHQLENELKEVCTAYNELHDNIKMMINSLYGKFGSKK